MEDKLLGIELVKIILKHARLIIILVLVAGISSAIFTSPIFIVPQYKAETVIYPSSSNTSTNLLNSDMRFGSETEINNEIQILHSSILRDSIISKYSLYTHYKIDTANPNKKYKINQVFNSNIKIDQSRYNSIVIGVYDADPVTATNIANDLVKVGDFVKSEIIKKNLRGAFSLVSRELNEKIKEITELGDSINDLRHKNYRDAISLQNNHYLSQKENVDNLRNSIVKIRNEEGIYDLNNQFNDIYASYLRANATYITDSGMVTVMKTRLKADDTALIKREAEMEGSKFLTVKLRDKLSKLNRSGRNYNALWDNYNFEKGILGGLKSEYEIATSTFEKEFPDLKLETLKNRYAAELLLFNNLKSKYELAFSNLTDQVPASYVISPAEIPTHKIYPNRLLVIVLISFATFILTVLYFLLADRIRNFISLINN
jgi:capsular polysaccharide biosynthesis protein